MNLDARNPRSFYIFERASEEDSDASRTLYGLLLFPAFILYSWELFAEALLTVHTGLMFRDPGLA